MSWIGQQQPGWWPFRLPELPDLAGLVSQAFYDVYWLGVLHGALSAAIVCIILAMVLAALWAIASILVGSKQGGAAGAVLVTVLGTMLGVLLWFSRGHQAPAPVIPVQPVPAPVKPAPKPWRPWGSEEQTRLCGIEDGQ